MAEMSFGERQRLVNAAIQQARGSTDLYVAEMFDDRAIYEEYGAEGGRSWEVPYTIDDAGEVTLGDRTEVRREVTYTAVKFVDDSDTQIEGLAIPFGGPFAGKDFHGEDFGPDTDLMPDLFPAGRPIIYNHGINKALGPTIQGRQTEHELTDEGVWARGELDKSAKYHSTVSKMIRDGKLFFSSGAIPHLVQSRKDGHITRWPWMELSLTPTPANPNAVVYAVKAADVIEHLEAADLAVPDQIKALIEREGGLESEPFAAHADRIAVALDAFAQRAELRHEWRAKAGRGISASNRAEIAEVVESLRPLGETWQRLSELLARTDPAAAEAAKVAERELLVLLREEARQQGVPV